MHPKRMPYSSDLTFFCRQVVGEMGVMNPTGPCTAYNNGGSLNCTHNAESSA